jgi:hypothetical protein
MARRKVSFIVLAVLIMAIALSGCSSPEVSNGKPLVVATIGAPTPVPTEPPEPTPGPTWVPTPTPVPDPISLTTEVKLEGVINGDQRPVSGDPNDSLQLNARYATRQDTARFTVKNTGDAPLEGLSIVYVLEVSMTTVGNGQYSTTVIPKSTVVDVGTLNRGDTKDLVILSPVYEAMQEVNMTIIAKWDNGTFQLYRATLEPDLSGGISQSDIIAVMTYGSANN